MSTERKEGVLIAAISIVALLILALLTEWESYGRKLDFSEANIQFNGFEVSCEFEYKSSGTSGFVDGNNCGIGGKKYILDFSLYFKTILIFALPIFSYGLLRAFGIVRRLFPFEEKLFKCVEEKGKL